MVYNQNFQSIKNDIVNLISMNEKPQVANAEVEKLVYPTEGKHIYQGMPMDAPHANLKLQSSAVYKMPGMRGRWEDAVEKVLNKKILYTKLFVKGFVSLAGAVAWFMFMSMPWQIVGYAFIFYGFLMLMEGHNHRIAAYDFEMNMGYVGSVVYDGAYETPKDYWGKDKVLGK